MLYYPDGSLFATGITSYQYDHASEDLTSRLLIEVEFEQFPTIAVIDTGAPYVVCAPDVARLLQFGRGTGLGRQVLNIRGIQFSGELHRMTVTFVAEEGESLYIDATAFVPEVRDDLMWGNLPSFIGLHGCLERMRFAVDPDMKRFLFGPAW